MNMRKISTIGLLFFLIMYGFCIKGFTQDTKDQENVVISINLPFTGPYREQSNEQLKAFQLAIEQINAEGGILGRKIIAEVADSSTKASLAAENARK